MLRDAFDLMDLVSASRMPVHSCCIAMRHNPAIGVAFASQWSHYAQCASHRHLPCQDNDGRLHIENEVLPIPACIPAATRRIA